MKILLDITKFNWIRVTLAIPINKFKFKLQIVKSRKNLDQK